MIEGKTLESILSLLVKILHKKKNNNGKLFIDFDEHINNSRIGDGPYFITNLLKKAAKLNAEYKKVIQTVLENINEDNLVGENSKEAEISM